jgi:hypothetical protein
MPQRKRESITEISRKFQIFIEPGLKPVLLSIKALLFSNKAVLNKFDFAKMQRVYWDWDRFLPISEIKPPIK